MPTGTESKQFSDISGNTAAFTLRGGRYVLVASGTPSGNLQVETLSVDGSTWVPPMNIGGSTNALTAAGSQTLDLPPGQYRIACGAWTAAYVSLASVPT